jgi:hypothetical protein
MKKSHRHNELSDRVCIGFKNNGCHKLIKQRMVDQKDARRCYKCYCLTEQDRGHTVNTKPRMKRLAKGLPVKSFK